MSPCICPLRDTALNDGNRTATWLDGQPVSYRRLDGLVNQVERQLVEQGLTRGDHLGILGHNSLAMLCLLVACLRQGIVYCPLNPRFTEKQINDLVPRLSLKRLWQDAPQVSTHCQPLALQLVEGPAGQDRISIDPGQACDLILTSGSSGHPKAVLHTVHNHLASARGAASRLPLSPSSCWLLSLPLFHIGGFAIVIRSLLAGSSMALSSQGDLSLALAQTPVTHLSLVNTQLYRLLRTEPSPLVNGHLEHLLLGGGPLQAGLIRQANALDLTCWTTYGMTEMGSQVTTGQVSGEETPLPSGELLPQREVRIDPAHTIWVRGETLFQGYYDAGTLNLPVDDQGWFNTGDQGYWQDRRLVVSGRRDNMFISGGENIQPETIEQALCQHPAIAQVVVVPQPDQEFGQRPVAFVQWHTQPGDSAALQQWLRQQLPGFMCPQVILPWPRQLDHPGLKVRRQDFQALL